MFMQILQIEVMCAPLYVSLSLLGNLPWLSLQNNKDVEGEIALCQINLL